MSSFIKWVIGIALGLAATGQLKQATLNMMEAAADAQKHQLSLSKLSRALNGPDMPVRHVSKSTR